MRGLLKPRVWNHLRLSTYGFSTAPAEGVDKALLSKLRKETGIPFINCKKALSKFNNDLDQAKIWLLEEAQKEGWARATKLQARPMSQGLIAVYGDSKQATMIEVNCETDFVARNEKFIAMVSKLVQDCNAHFEESNENQLFLNKAALDQIVGSEKSTLSDIVALNVGNLGENMALRRGTFIRASNGTVLSSYVHPSSASHKSSKSVILGKYGAIVEMLPKTPSDDHAMSIADLGSHLCQHIVGMNPKSVGEFELTDKKMARQEEDGSKNDSGYSSDVSSDTDNAESSVDGQEDKLLHQEFLLDSSVTVGELVADHGIEITNFIRFACGEELEGENES